MKDWLLRVGEVVMGITILYLIFDPEKAKINQEHKILSSAKEKLWIVLFAPIQGEVGGGGSAREQSVAKSVRIFFKYVS